jgi:protein-tyrosine phosphatase
MLPSRRTSRIICVSAALAACSACSSQPLPGAAREREESPPPFQPPGSPVSSAPAEDGACAPGRRILADEIMNARDLGGISVSGEQRVACGALFRGPPLAALSAEGCGELDRLGIRTVVDLRTPAERTSRPEASCVSARAELVFAPLPIPYNLSPGDYIADLNATESMALAFQKFVSPAAYPIYFHCTWGRDRTGVVAAVILLALGAARADILEEYQRSAASVGAYPESLAAVLDAIERQGGIVSYLEALGLTSEEIATLRKQALEAIR